nr:S8 family serine peptidase [Ardenticatena sp.]
MKTRIAVVLAVVLAAVSIFTVVRAEQPTPAADGKLQFEPATAQPISPFSLGEGIVVQPKDAQGDEWYIVQLKEPPLALYEGGIEGLAPTANSVTGARKLDVTSPASQAYLAYLDTLHAQRLNAIEQALGRDVEKLFDYKVAFNGFSIRLSPDEAEAVAKVPGVRMVQRDFYRYPLTDVGPQWIGAPTIWNTYNYKGEGVIVGVIDTGINMDHPSFADVGDDGYDHTNPFGSGNYVGWCDPNNPNYDPQWVCNDKLIGVWDFHDAIGDESDGPEDGDGHGSHTASTAAGNVVYSPTLYSTTATNPVYTPTAVFTFTMISGVAPHANIIAYDACGPVGCAGSALVAAINQATADGVDVINYSIGGGSNDPWNDADAQAFFGAWSAGIVPVTSAGNSGPSASTIGSPADAPWMVSVGASTHNRKMINALINMTGTVGTPPPDLYGTSVTPGYGPARIVYAGWYDNDGDGDTDLDDAQCLQPFAPGTFDGEIVVCDRGQIARVQKGANVRAGGAGGFVLANTADQGESTSADQHVLPAVHLGVTAADQLRNWLSDPNGVYTATILGTTLDLDPSNGDIMASFSSRGPNPATNDVIKPDVTNPGVSILAAYNTDGVSPSPEFAMISGTSMSSPHTAGSAALMRGLFPNWTPDEIKSALMLTADTTVLDDDGQTPATPFARGAGRVDLSTAPYVGFVLDETESNYIAANPSTGGEPNALNIASLADSACLQSCSWTRIITSTVPITVNYVANATIVSGTIAVQPSSFALPPGGTQVITVTVNVNGLPDGEWLFGQVNITPSTTTQGVSIVGGHMPVAVVPTSGVLPDSVTVEARRNAGSYLMPDNISIEITDLTIGMYGPVKGTIHTFDLTEDPTNRDPYDDLSQVHWVTVTVPMSATRLVAEVFESEAPDVDLFVGTGATPSEATEMCKSTTSSFVEYCNIDNPTPGTWWILVQNWKGTGAADTISFSYAVVPGTDTGEIQVTGPITVPAETPYDLRLFWDIPTMSEGDRYYAAFDVGSNPSSPGNIGRVPVDLRRIEDDVSKTADRNIVGTGETATFTITINPNTLPEDLLYTLTDTLPTGFSLVPGSIQVSEGTVVTSGNQIVWNVTMKKPGFTYKWTTSDMDPACAVPFSAFDGDPDAYTDLAAFGIGADANINGDTQVFAWGLSGDPSNITYFGQQVGNTLYFTDDGFVAFDDPSAYTNPWVNRPIPYADAVNNLLALFWHDWVIQYDAANNYGVSLANLTSGGIPVAHILEYDDVFEYNAITKTLDMQIYIERDPFASDYDIIFAYDNISMTMPTWGTVGVENADGTVGVAPLPYNNINLHDGMAICFDMYPLAQPATLTYQVTVDDGVASGTYTNTVTSTTDNPGSKATSTNASVTVPQYAVSLTPASQSMSAYAGNTVTYTLTLQNQGAFTDTFTVQVVGNSWMTTAPASIGPLAPGASNTFNVVVTVPMSAQDGEMDTASVLVYSQGATQPLDVSPVTTADIMTQAKWRKLFAPLVFTP